MCVPLENRTLRGGLHDKIYAFFEKYGFCTKYVQDSRFLKYMSYQTTYKATPEDDKIKFAQMVESVDWFIEVSEWRKELRMLASVEFMALLDDLHAFDDIESYEKGPVAYHQMCYHLGMIMFDYMDSQ